jgi:hypothetical protein
MADGQNGAALDQGSALFLTWDGGETWTPRTSLPIDTRKSGSKSPPSPTCSLGFESNRPDEHPNTGQRGSSQTRGKGASDSNDGKKAEEARSSQDEKQAGCDLPLVSQERDHTEREGDRIRSEHTQQQRRQRGRRTLLARYRYRYRCSDHADHDRRSERGSVCEVKGCNPEHAQHPDEECDESDRGSGSHGIRLRRPIRLSMVSFTGSQNRGNGPPLTAAKNNRRAPLWARRLLEVTGRSRGLEA